MVQIFGCSHLPGMTSYICAMGHNAHILVFLLFGNIALGVGVFDVLHIISTFPRDSGWYSKCPEDLLDGSVGLSSVYD